jgi:hypothetical protein
MASRQCPFCGQLIPEDAASCFKCRETMPEAVAARGRNPAAGYYEIRRGLLYMLMAAVFYYFASGESGYEIPVPFLPIVVEYLLPALFIGGTGLFLYGIVLKIKG